MGKNNRKGATNKDALDATGRKEKNALFANCSAWMAKAKEKGAEEHMRKMRIASSLEYFQSYRLAVYQAIAKEEPVPKFKAPVPKMRDGLSALCELYTGLFASEKMVTSLIKCFQSVGLAMTTAGGCEPHFKKYQLGTRHGAQPTAKPSTDDTDLSLGGTLLPMCSRCGCDEDEEPDKLDAVEPNDSGDECGSDNEHSC
jgi:hypothetical protein